MAGDSTDQTIVSINKHSPTVRSSTLVGIASERDRRMHRQSIAETETAMAKLDAWVRQNGWAGFDPYDVRPHPWMRRLRAPLGADTPRGMWRGPVRAVRFLGSGFGDLVEDMFPVRLRRYLRIKPEINAKAMGLFAKAYFRIYSNQSITTDRAGADYLARAKECLTWLEANRSPGYAGHCWGYPFDWQSRILIPAGTPSSVVSCIVGDAFWIAWKTLGDAKYLEICQSIYRFLVTDLNRDDQPDSLCFSYTPLDDFHVHNANLFVADFLVRIGQACNDNKLTTLGLKAANYALDEQREDGSLPYWGDSQASYNPTAGNDHYHIGYEIRCLYGLWESTGDIAFEQAYRRYFRYYGEHLLDCAESSDTDEQGLAVSPLPCQLIPRMSWMKRYPINIHSCAEALLLNARLADQDDEARSRLAGLSRWISNNMQTGSGWFRYKIKRCFGRDCRIDVPYIRWGQAWMLLALVETLITLDSDSSSNGHDPRLHSRTD